MRMRRRRALAALAAAAALAAVAGGCTNNPYPEADSERKILYGVFNDAPRTLDPAKAYTTNATQVNGNIYDTLLEYHFLKRPYVLIPGLAESVPEAEPLPDGRVRYVFRLRPDLLYQDDPCFALSEQGATTRQVVAADLVFELQRIADPAVNSPVIEPFSNIDGLRAFSERLIRLREDEDGFSALPVREQYRRAGPVAGLRAVGDLELRVTLEKPYPQILYWFAMPFSTPVPWEAVAWYDGEEGRPHLSDHPVGAGPYRLAEYDKQFRIVLERNDNWYGVRHPEWKAPAATYPDEGMPGDREAGRLEPRYTGRPLPFIERIELRREKEPIPRFNKFLQGYYDASSITKESFDQVIVEGDLSPEMREQGIQLEKHVEPSVFYIGFNMEDPVVGHPGGERSRKLRQAMSLAIDAEEFLELFLNGRGVPAQSPIPPGIFGYDEDYRNPYRAPAADLGRARALLAEAGYPGGIDPETGRPLHLTFDTGNTSAQAILQYKWFINAWRRLGIDVELAATAYNQFQEKVRKGSYQVFMWGWIADYPDPENFLFLLWSEMRRSVNEGPNSANFSDERYDELYLAMKARPNDRRRREIIDAMQRILERERPWIELFHSEDYALYHGWVQNLKPSGLSFPTIKYRDLDPEQRAVLREEWNEPVLWPAAALAGLLLAVTLPGVVTFYRERQ